MKAVRNPSTAATKKTIASGEAKKEYPKESNATIDAGRRKLGIFSGMPGYFMSDDFCITTKEEFDI
ncbi:hypothetical protein GCM10010967_45300 [Dyadobacter beijingensis]|uniref:Uncharacterized protein n=1 Tax=Dyadobacter beijingensis TaxID=365489 RepID=A0ABQ2IA63_9BACT|nr:hypothetical protein [Dyadobacter beijingensis]GGN05119.1 hypothetical protein GCM10010967_45300 [Dyadobacter beijingensis]